MWELTCTELYVNFHNANDRILATARAQRRNQAARHKWYFGCKLIGLDGKYIRELENDLARASNLEGIGLMLLYHEQFAGLNILFSLYRWD